MHEVQFRRAFALVVAVTLFGAGCSPQQTTLPPASNADDQAAAASVADDLPTCGSGVDVLDFDEAYRQREDLRGREVAVRGMVGLAGAQCTEDECGNECSYATQLGPSSQGPSMNRLLLLESDATVQLTRFNCKSSVGDSCGSAEEPSSTDVECSTPMPTSEVVVIGTLGPSPDVAVSCDPVCDEPWGLVGVSLCRP